MEYLLLSVLFIAASTLIKGFLGMGVYLAAYIVFIIINRKTIKLLILIIKNKLLTRKKKQIPFSK